MSDSDIEQYYGPNSRRGFIRSGAPSPEPQPQPKPTTNTKRARKLVYADSDRDIGDGSFVRSGAPSPEPQPQPEPTSRKIRKFEDHNSDGDSDGGFIRSGAPSPEPQPQPKPTTKKVRRSNYYNYDRDSEGSFIRSGAPSPEPQPQPKSTAKKRPEQKTTRTSSKRSKLFPTKDRKRGGPRNARPTHKIPKDVTKSFNPVELGSKDGILVGMSTKEFVEWADNRVLNFSRIKSCAEMERNKGYRRPVFEKVYGMYWEPTAFDSGKEFAREYHSVN